jgi:hypothetical protein
MLDKESLEALSRDIPEEDVLKLLQPLNNEHFSDREQFIEAITQHIGAERVEKYSEQILSRAEERLRINPIFDHRQWWCWSADKIKGEGSPGPAWHVSFGYGYVHWYTLSSSTYVRAVRSRRAP